MTLSFTRSWQATWQRVSTATLRIKLRISPLPLHRPESWQPKCESSFVPSIFAVEVQLDHRISAKLGMTRSEDMMEFLSLIEREPLSHGASAHLVAVAHILIELTVSLLFLRGVSVAATERSAQASSQRTERLWRRRSCRHFRRSQAWLKGEVPCRIAAEAAVRSGSCDLRRSRSHPPGDGESVSSRAITARYRSICEHPVESRRTPRCPPVTFPPDGEWFVRVIASKDQFVFGVYRRHIKTIDYLSQIDKLFGVPATTRNWNTILAVVRILKGQEKKATE